MKAIETRYMPCTNTRGSRIKAMAEGGNAITIPYPHELSGAAAHAAAAVALCKKMGWTNHGGLVSGGNVKNTGYVFCFADSETFAIN